MKLKNQRRRDIDADEDYNYDNSGKGTDRDSSNNRKEKSGRKEYDNTISYGKGEIGLDLNHFEGGMQTLLRFTKNLPKVNLQLDPVINFKLKQKISHFGACITLGENTKALPIFITTHFHSVDCTLTLDNGNNYHYHKDMIVIAVIML